MRCFSELSEGGDACGNDGRPLRFEHPDSSENLMKGCLPKDLYTIKVGELDSLENCQKDRKQKIEANGWTLRWKIISRVSAVIILLTTSIMN